jgi:hypothetical protein
VTTQRDGLGGSKSECILVRRCSRVGRQYNALEDMAMLFSTRVASTHLYVHGSIATISNVARVIQSKRNSVVHPSCHAVAAKACGKAQTRRAHGEIRDDVP